ncbi:MAG: nuclease-related domain-containing protein [Burkholderiales bacterium]
MTHLWMLLFDVFVLGGICFLGAVVFLWRYRSQRSGRRSPLARNLLRSPGESLRARIEDTQWDIASFLAAGMLPLPAVLGLYFASWVGGSGAPTATTAVSLAVLGLAAQSWLGWKLWQSLWRLRRLKLGHEAQLAVGQELAELGRAGFRIFHDFPAGDGRFNLDHVLVGPSGVFLVETKGRSDTDTPWEVQYDGRVLQFPGWVETEPLVQARANADALQRWLSGAVGQGIPVEPVVALPGWLVQRVAEEGMPVLAAREIQAYFTSRPNLPLMSAQLIQQIVHQLDQKCRDVAPRACAQPQEGPGVQAAPAAKAHTQP